MSTLKNNVKAKRGFRKKAKSGLVSRVYKEVMTPEPIYIDRADSDYQSIRLADILSSYRRFTQMKNLFQQYKLNFVKVLINPLNDFVEMQLEPWKILYLTSLTNPPNLPNMLSSPSSRIVPTNKNSTFTFKVRGRQNDQNYWFDNSEYFTSLLLFGSTSPGSELVHVGKLMIQLKFCISFRYPLTSTSTSRKQINDYPKDVVKVNRVKQLINEVNDVLKEMKGEDKKEKEGKEEEQKDKAPYLQDQDIIETAQKVQQIAEYKNINDILLNFDRVISAKEALVKNKQKFVEYKMEDYYNSCVKIVEELDKLVDSLMEHEEYQHTEGEEFLDDSVPG
jgi:hypothetical protein